jgi:hypothetical protein
VIQLPLDDVEIRELERYLGDKGQTDVAAYKAHVLFLFGRSRFIDVIELQSKVSGEPFVIVTCVTCCCPAHRVSWL